MNRPLLPHPLLGGPSEPPIFLPNLQVPRIKYQNLAPNPCSLPNGAASFGLFTRNFSQIQTSMNFFNQFPAQTNNVVYSPYYFNNVQFPNGPPPFYPSAGIPLSEFNIGQTIYAKNRGRTFTNCLKPPIESIPSSCNIEQNLLTYNIQNNQEEHLEYKNNSKTIVFENDPDIQEVSMAVDLDDASDTSSSFEPSRPESLIDFELNLPDDLAELGHENKSQDVCIKLDTNLPEEQYWKVTRDCDYRFQVSNSNDMKEVQMIEENLKIHKLLSQKKHKKIKKRERESLAIDINNVDSLPYEELISVYEKLKEELTLLNCDTMENEVSPDSQILTSEIDKMENIPFTDNLVEIPDNVGGSDQQNEEIIVQNEGPTDFSPASPTENDEQDKLNLILDGADCMVEIPHEEILSENDPKQQNLSELLRNEIQAALKRGFESDSFSENLLRERLIRNVLESRIEPEKNEIVLSTSKNIVAANYGNMKPVNGFNEKKQFQSRQPIKPPAAPINVPTAPTKPLIDSSKFHLVIQLSDEDESEVESGAPEEQHRPEPENNRSDGFIHKLSKSQQEEYQKLKQEIERREAKAMSIASLLKCESKLKHSIMLRRQKSGQIGRIRRDMFTATKQLKKTQTQIFNLKKLLHSANQRAKLFAVKLQLETKKLEKVETGLKTDAQTIAHYRAMCRKIGQKVKGTEYSVPSFDVDLKIERKTRRRIDSFNKMKESLRKSGSKESETSLIFLRNQIKFLLKSNYLFETVLLFEQYVGFNFALFQSSHFYQSSKYNIEFNEFSKNCHPTRAETGPPPDSIVDRNPTNDNYESVLEHFNSYRFATHKNYDITADCWSNALNPDQFICVFELFGVCNDLNCKFQHQKDYIFEAQEKVIDVLTYLPELDSVNLEQCKNDPKALRAFLIEFVRKKMEGNEQSIEQICRDISSDVKNQSKTSISSFLIRSLPKELINFSENIPQTNRVVPYADYHYRFDLKDDSFKMKRSQLKNFRLNNDPDFYLKNRFFAPEGVPISAQLEASLASDPNNIAMWINLAYCYLKCRDGEDQNLNACLNSSLNVLSRAIEANRQCAELYEQYLILYSQKVDLIAMHHESVSGEPDETLLPIAKICERILKHCSTYKLWICYLNLCADLAEKQKIVIAIIERSCDGRIRFENDEQRSWSMIEIVMYRINQLLQLNRHADAVQFFHDVFGEETKTEARQPLSQQQQQQLPQFVLSKLTAFITKQHCVFAWLCYIHLILFRCLPYHAFQLCKKSSFLYLANVQPFIFQWQRITSENDLFMIERVLTRAIESCCAYRQKSNVDIGDNNEDTSLGEHRSLCGNSCFALRFNLAQLDKVLQCRGKREANMSNAPAVTNSFSYLSTVYSDNFEALTHLHILQLFDINLSCEDDAKPMLLNLNENFYNGYKQAIIYEATVIDDEFISTLKHQIQFNYWLAFYHYKNNRNVTKCRQILTNTLSYYFRDAGAIREKFGDARHLLRMYKFVLLDNYRGNDKFSFEQQEMAKKLKFGNDKQASRLVYLYLSYLLLLHLSLRERDLTTEQHYLKLERAFNSAVNSFTSSVNPNASKSDYIFLWLNYFLLLLDFPFSAGHFKQIYETLRHICVAFNSSDPIFIYHLTSAFSEIVVPRDQLFFLIEISKLNPDNVNLIIKVVNLALHQSKKETLWNYITHLVYECKIRLQCFEFWKIAISLSIERNDHLNTHKFFQMAISSMPFHVQLWEMVLYLLFFFSLSFRSFATLAPRARVAASMSSSAIAILILTPYQLVQTCAAQKLRIQHQSHGTSESIEEFLSQHAKHESKTFDNLI